MRIQYEINRTLCVTDCNFELHDDYYPPAYRGTPKKVGSVTCRRCEHFVSRHREEMCIECNHPGLTNRNGANS